MTPTFRHAAETDVAGIVMLVESAYRGAASRVGWTTEADLLGGQRTDAEAVVDMLRAPRSIVLLAETNGELMACCLVEHRPPSGAYFGMFSVRPGEQGQGLGRRVLAEAERLARDEWAATTMVMTVLTQRADLIAWYERRGYRRTGEQEPFPYGNERYGIPRRPDLVFDVLAKALTAES